MLAEATPALETFFKPYNALLRQLIHPSFSWSAKDHYKRPLNESEKKRRIDEAWKYRLFLRRRQARPLTFLIAFESAD